MDCLENACRRTRIIACGTISSGPQRPQRAMFRSSAAPGVVCDNIENASGPARLPGIFYAEALPIKASDHPEIEPLPPSLIGVDHRQKRGSHQDAPKWPDNSKHNGNYN
jgi:hypothetical protein